MPHETAQYCAQPAIYYVAGTSIRLCRKHVREYQHEGHLIIHDPSLAKEGCLCRWIIREAGSGKGAKA